MIKYKDVEKEIDVNKKEIIKKLVDFAFTDVLLFWSGNNEIKYMQVEKWQPILCWLGERFDLRLEKSGTNETPKKNKDSRVCFETILEKMSLNNLTAFYLAAIRMKSPLLALAMIEGKIGAEDAYELAFLEEMVQKKSLSKEMLNKHKQIKKELIEISEYIKNNEKVL